MDPLTLARLLREQPGSPDAEAEEPLPPGVPPKDYWGNAPGFDQGDVSDLLGAMWGGVKTGAHYGLSALNAGGRAVRTGLHTLDPVRTFKSIYTPELASSEEDLLRDIGYRYTPAGPDRPWSTAIPDELAKFTMGAATDPLIYVNFGATSLGRANAEAGLKATRALYAAKGAGLKAAAATRAAPASLWTEEAVKSAQMLAEQRAKNVALNEFKQTTGKAFPDMIDLSKLKEPGLERGFAARLNAGEIGMQFGLPFKGMHTEALQPAGTAAKWAQTVLNPLSTAFEIGALSRPGQWVGEKVLAPAGKFLLNPQMNDTFGLAVRHGEKLATIEMRAAVESAFKPIREKLTESKLPVELWDDVGRLVQTKNAAGEELAHTAATRQEIIGRVSTLPEAQRTAFYEAERMTSKALPELLERLKTLGVPVTELGNDLRNAATGATSEAARLRQKVDVEYADMNPAAVTSREEAAALDEWERGLSAQANYARGSVRQDLMDPSKYNRPKEEADAVIKLMDALDRRLKQRPSELALPKEARPGLYGRMGGIEAGGEGAVRTAEEMAQAYSVSAEGRVLSSMRIDPLTGLHILTAFKGANIGSVTHEVGHIVRNILTPEELAPVTEWLRTAHGYNGPWLRDAVRMVNDGRFVGTPVQIAAFKAEARHAEELYAEAFNDYLRTGEAPAGASKGLKGVFEYLKSIWKDVWQVIKGEKLKMTPEMRAHFNDLLGEKVYIPKVKPKISQADKPLPKGALIGDQPRPVQVKAAAAEVASAPAPVADKALKRAKDSLSAAQKGGDAELIRKARNTYQKQLARVNGEEAVVRAKPEAPVAAPVDVPVDVPVVPKPLNEKTSYLVIRLKKLIAAGGPDGADAQRTLDAILAESSIHPSSKLKVPIVPSKNIIVQSSRPESFEVANEAIRNLEGQRTIVDDLLEAPPRKLTAAEKQRRAIDEAAGLDPDLEQALPVGATAQAARRAEFEEAVWQLREAEEQAAKLNHLVRQIPAYFPAVLKKELLEKPVLGHTATATTGGGINYERSFRHGSAQGRKYLSIKIGEKEYGVPMTSFEEEAQIMAGTGTKATDHMTPKENLGVIDTLKHMFKSKEALEAARKDATLITDPIDGIGHYLAKSFAAPINRHGFEEALKSSFGSIPTATWDDMVKLAGGGETNLAGLQAFFKERTGIELEKVLEANTFKRLQAGADLRTVFGPQGGPKGMAAITLSGESYFVPRNIADRYARQIHYSTTALPETVQSIVAAIQPYTRFWKQGQTVLWPAFHIRNLVSDLFRMMQEGALDTQTPGDMLKLTQGMYVASRGTKRGFSDPRNFAHLEFDAGESGVKEFGARQVKGDRLVQHVLDENLLGSGQLQQSFYDAADKTLTRGFFEKHGLPDLQKIPDFFENLKVGVSGREDIERIAAVLARMRAGDSFIGATLQAEKALFNYAHVSPAADFLRRTGVAPFISWMAKNIPAQVEYAVLHPGQFAAMLRGVEMLQDHTVPENMLPQYLKDNFNLVFQQGKDPRGKPRWEYATASGIIPITDLLDLAKSDAKDLILRQLGPAYKLGLGRGLGFDVGQRDLGQDVLGKMWKVPANLIAGEQLKPRKGTADVETWEKTKGRAEQLLDLVNPLHRGSVDVLGALDRSDHKAKSELGRTTKALQAAQQELNMAEVVGEPESMQQLYTDAAQARNRYHQAEATHREQMERSQRVRQRLARYQLVP